MGHSKGLAKAMLERSKPMSKKAQARLESGVSSAAGSRVNSRAPSRHGSDDEDGNLTDSTNWSVNSIDDMLATDASSYAADTWKQDLSDRMEKIIDRKGSGVQQREVAIMQYGHYLMSHYAFEEIEHKTSELFPALLKSVKAEDSEKETCMALRAIALTIITNPTDNAYDAIFAVLKSTYTSSEFPSVKARAIHTLSIAAIYGGASDDAVEELTDDFLEIIESDGSSIEAADDGDVVTAACEAWGFLATSIDDMSEKTETAMDAFVEQLESSDVSVQIAAGENIALLFEKSYTEREAGDDPVSDEEDEEGFPKDAAYVKRYEVYRQKNQLEHTLSELATESSKRVAKKSRKALHTNFADILNTVEHPSRGPRYQNAIDQETGHRYGSRMTVKLDKDTKMMIDRWWKLHTLQALKRVLGGGLNVHYGQNQVIYDSLP